MERESPTEHQWHNKTVRHSENRRPLTVTKTQPGNERFIENSLTGERTVRLHRLGLESAETSDNCGESGVATLRVSQQLSIQTTPP